MERGSHVRALTRDPRQDAARALADRGAEVVEGDFDDRESLDRALDRDVEYVRIPWKAFEEQAGELLTGRRPGAGGP